MKKRLDEIKKQAGELLQEAKHLEDVERNHDIWQQIVKTSKPLDWKVTLKEGASEKPYVDVYMVLEITPDMHIQCNFRAERDSFQVWREDGVVNMMSMDHVFYEMSKDWGEEE